MANLTRKCIDWTKTARKLKLLRERNERLRLNVCRALNLHKGNCKGDCDACSLEMDNHISQSELASVFGYSASIIANWENGKSKPSIEDLIFYSQLCGLELFDVLIFSE